MKLPIIKAMGVILLIAAAVIAIYFIYVVAEGAERWDELYARWSLWMLIMGFVFCLIFGIKAIFIRK